MHTDGQGNAAARPDIGLRVRGRSIEELSAQVRSLVPDVDPRRLTSTDREDFALLFDDLLRVVFRGKGALALRIGEHLHWLDHGDRLLTVGYHRMTDFAREECGLTEADARSYRRLAVALETRPLLRAAVQAGDVSPVKVERVKRVAVGEDEAPWVERAKVLTVRALTEEVKAARVARELATAPEAAAPGAAEVSPEAEEPVWVPLVLPASGEDLALFRETVALARRSLGADAPRGRCVEAMAQEVLGSTSPPERRGPWDTLLPTLHRPPPPPVRAPSPDLRGWLESQSDRWSFLDQAVPTVEGDAPVTDSTDPFLVRAEVLRLSELMRSWDVLACRLSLLLRFYGVWRDMQFLNLHHYATERLGVSGRAIEQRAWLEAKMFEWPPLRAALEDGTLCYARALEVARADGEVSVEWAARHSVIQIRHRVEDLEDTKMFKRHELRVLLPEDVLEVVDDALRALQAAAERAGLFVHAADAFWLMVRHAYRTWEPLTPKPSPLRRRLEARKRALCEAYGCTMPGVDMHHVEFRAHQGPDGPENRVLLCRPHHQRGAHGPGHTQLEPLGDEVFEWRFGCRPGEAPLRVVVTGIPLEPDPGLRPPPDPMWEILDPDFFEPPPERPPEPREAP